MSGCTARAATWRTGLRSSNWPCLPTGPPARSGGPTSTGCCSLRLPIRCSRRCAARCFAGPTWPGRNARPFAFGCSRFGAVVTRNTRTVKVRLFQRLPGPGRVPTPGATTDRRIASAARSRSRKRPEIRSRSAARRHLTPKPAEKTPPRVPTRPAQRPRSALHSSLLRRKLPETTASRPQKNQNPRLREICGLALDALEQALYARVVDPHDALVHHGDRGSQYLSIRYTERLAEAGIEQSVGSVGDSYDNALAESIIGLYKTEVIRHRGPWRSLEAGGVRNPRVGRLVQTTAGSSSRSETDLRPRPKRRTIAKLSTRRWPRDSHTKQSPEFPARFTHPSGGGGNVEGPYRPPRLPDPAERAGERLERVGPPACGAATVPEPRPLALAARVLRRSGLRPAGKEVARLRGRAEDAAGDGPREAERCRVANGEEARIVGRRRSGAARSREHEVAVEGRVRRGPPPARSRRAPRSPSGVAWACVRLMFVATTAMVVFAPGASASCLPPKVASTAGARSAMPAPPNSSPIANGAAQNSRLPGTVTDPTGFAATSAPTMDPASEVEGRGTEPALEARGGRPRPRPPPSRARSPAPHPRTPAGRGPGTDSPSTSCRRRSEGRRGSRRGRPGPAPRPTGEAAAGRHQCVRDPRRGVEPEDGAAGEGERIHLLHEPVRCEEVRLPRARRAPHDVHGGHERFPPR